MKKGHQKFHPYPFLNVLNQNKAFHNFRKTGQRSIVECNIGLEYALSYKSEGLSNFKG